VAAALEIWSEKTGLGLAIINPGLIYSDIDSVIPDVVWVSHNRLAQIEDQSGHLTASPELVIEVLSSGKDNERRDRETKLKLYSIQGVQEYWIINWQTQQVDPSSGTRLTWTSFCPLFAGISHVSCLP
jgi:Uma2 family endonuclease